MDRNGFVDDVALERVDARSAAANVDENFLRALRDGPTRPRRNAQEQESEEAEHPLRYTRAQSAGKQGVVKRDIEPVDDLDEESIPLEDVGTPPPENLPVDDV